MTHDVDRVAVEPTLFVKNIIEKKKIERFTLNDEKDYLFQNLMALVDTYSKYEIKFTWFLLALFLTCSCQLKKQVGSKPSKAIARFFKIAVRNYHYVPS